MRTGLLRSAVMATLLVTTFAAAARTWADRFGRPFEAEFVRLDGASVIFTLPNNRLFATPLAELSAADQLALRNGAPQPQAQSQSPQPSPPADAVAGSFGRPWPREIRLDGPVACKVVAEDAKTGRYVYQSPGYRFTCDARVTDDALRNFAVMFEATRKYALGMPLGLGGGRERQGKLDVLLFGRLAAYQRAGGPPGSAGCFTSGSVLVPMASLGLIEGRTGFSLDPGHRNNSVLVHELAHQLTPNAYLEPGALGWFSEGLAEYMAITPYNWGYYQLDIHGNVVKAYVTGHGIDGGGGRALGTTLKAPALKDFLLMPYSQYSGPNANFNYGIGLLLTHYFCHMESSGKAVRITRFLKGLQAGQRGEAALAPLLGDSTYQKLEGEIAAAWQRMGVQLSFGGGVAPIKSR